MCGMTIADIGELKEVSTSVIRAMKENTMRKLRRPETRHILCYGYDYQNIREELESVQLEYDKAYEDQQKTFIEKREKIIKELQLHEERAEDQPEVQYRG